MNIDNLITAAREIDRLAVLQEKKTRHLAELARKARTASPDELRAIQSEVRSSSGTVTDFGNAISALRRALNQRSARKSRPDDQPKEQP